MDKIIFPLLCDGNQYIPSVNKMKLEWTKASNNRIFMASEYNVGAQASSYHGNARAVPNITNLKTYFKEFTWHLDYRILNTQLKDALNLLLESKMAVVKSYISQTCVVTKEHNLTTTLRLDNDIFYGSLPYKLYVFAM